MNMIYKKNSVKGQVLGKNDLLHVINVKEMCEKMKPEK